MGVIGQEHQSVTSCKELKEGKKHITGEEKKFDEKQTSQGGKMNFNVRQCTCRDNNSSIIQ